MVATCIVHMHITAEPKPTGLCVLLLNSAVAEHIGFMCMSVF